MFRGTTNKYKMISYYSNYIKTESEKQKLSKIHGNDHVTCTISKRKYADHIRSSNSLSIRGQETRIKGSRWTPQRRADGVVVCRVFLPLRGDERKEKGGADGLVKLLSYADSAIITRKLTHHLFHETYAGVFARPQGG